MRTATFLMFALTGAIWQGEGQHRAHQAEQQSEALRLERDSLRAHTDIYRSALRDYMQRAAASDTERQRADQERRVAVYLRAVCRGEKASLTASTREIQRGAARYAELLVRAEGRLSQCQAY